MTDPNEPPGRRAYASFAQRYADLAPTKAHTALYERPATMALLGDVDGLTVPDAGCGPGICCEHLARRSTGAQCCAGSSFSVPRNASISLMSCAVIAGLSPGLRSNGASVTSTFARYFGGMSSYSSTLPSAPRE